MSDPKNDHDQEPRESTPGMPVDPYTRLVQAWAEGTKAAGAAMQQFLDTAATTATTAGETTGNVAAGVAGAAADPQATAADLAQGWTRALGQLAELQTTFFRKVAEDLPHTAKQRVDAASFSQLGRMASANWEEELRRFSEVPAALGERLSAGDPDRLAGLLQTMLTEYMADLETLKGSAFTMKLDDIVDAFARTATGTADPEARRIMDRLVEAMAVKSRYGAEYYADPDTTPVGQTPRTCVHEQGRLQLFRYQKPDGSFNDGGPPVLLVYSVINKPYILDLLPGYSFIEHLVEQGVDPYLIEWGDTDPGDNTTTLDSYVDPGIHGCVQAIQQRTGVEKVPLFGHCIGGNLALMYAALHPDNVDRVVTLTTPMTAAEGGVVAVWTDRDVLPVDSVVDTYGHMPAKLIRYTFVALKPYYEVMKWKMFLEQLGNDDVMRLFLPVDRWANDNVDIPGLVFKKFIEEVFHGDRFRHGETRINGRLVDLKNVTCPVMNLAAKRDWIVPPESAAVLEQHVGSTDYRFVEIEGAHVGIMIDPRTRPLWTDMSDFLQGESPAPSSR